IIAVSLPIASARKKTPTPDNGLGVFYVNRCLGVGYASMVVTRDTRRGGDIVRAGNQSNSPRGARQGSGRFASALGAGSAGGFASGSGSGVGSAARMSRARPT